MKNEIGFIDKKEVQRIRDENLDKVKGKNGRIPVICKNVSEKVELYLLMYWTKEMIESGVDVNQDESKNYLIQRL